MIKRWYDKFIAILSEHSPGYYGEPLKRLFDLFFRGTRRVLNNLLGQPDCINHITVYPALNDRETLGDLMNHICWYLPETPSAQWSITVPVSDELLSGGDIDIASLPPPKGHQSCLGPMRAVRFVRSDESTALMRSAEQVLVWDSAFLKKPHVLRHIRKIRVADPRYWGGVDTAEYMLLYERMTNPEQRGESRGRSLANYDDLLQHVRPSSEAYLFLTGPSLEQAMKMSFPDNALKMICNAVIAAGDVVDHIRPNVFAICDAVFFGPSKYAARLRQHMIEAFRRHDFYVVVPDHQVPMMLGHYPELADRLIGIPISQSAGPWNFPSPEKFFVRSVANIFVIYMLPVASAAVDNTFVIGADGKGPAAKENRDWTHSDRFQLDELKGSAWETHPTMAKKNYDAIYEMYCKAVERFMEFGESRGKKYHSLTDSHIPALKKRRSGGQSKL